MKHTVRLSFVVTILGFVLLSSGCGNVRAGVFGPVGGTVRGGATSGTRGASGGGVTRPEVRPAVGAAVPPTPGSVWVSRGASGILTRAGAIRAGWPGTLGSVLVPVRGSSRAA